MHCSLLSRVASRFIARSPYQEVPHSDSLIQNLSTCTYAILKQKCKKNTFCWLISNALNLKKKKIPVECPAALKQNKEFSLKLSAGRGRSAETQIIYEFDAQFWFVVYDRFDINILVLLSRSVTESQRGFHPPAKQPINKSRTTW